jgi:hypothetical protein
LEHWVSQLKATAVRVSLPKLSVETPRFSSS